MTVRVSKIGTVHAIAICSDCSERWEDYLTAVDKARQHAEDTGHSVKIERGQTWTYNPKRAAR